MPLLFIYITYYYTKKKIKHRKYKKKIDFYLLDQAVLVDFYAFHFREIYLLTSIQIYLSFEYFHRFKRRD